MRTKEQSCCVQLLVSYYWGLRRFMLNPIPYDSNFENARLDVSGWTLTALYQSFLSATTAPSSSAAAPQPENEGFLHGAFLVLRRPGNSSPAFVRSLLPKSDGAD